jgi:hypothetical protein
MVGRNLITAGLFWEATKDPRYAVFSMQEHPGPTAQGYPCFRDTYLEYTVKDPTEYTLAIALVGSWKHWTKICKSPLLEDYILSLRAERDKLIESNAIKKIFKQAEEGNYQAAKLLVNRGYEIKLPDQVKNNKKKEKQKIEVMDEDLARILNSE